MTTFEIGVKLWCQQSLAALTWGLLGWRKSAVSHATDIKLRLRRVFEIQEA